MTHSGSSRREVASFVSGPYIGQRVELHGESLLIVGSGPVAASYLVDADRRGELNWADAGIQNWAHERAGYEAAVASQAATDAPSAKPNGGGIVMMILGGALATFGVLISFTGIGVLIGLPMALVGGAMFGTGYRRRQRA